MTSWTYAPAPESAALANLRPAYRPFIGGKFVDGGGEWTHWVVESEEAAASLAEAAGAPLHREWTDTLSRRVNDGNPWADPKGQRRAL